VLGVADSGEVAAGLLLYFSVTFHTAAVFFALFALAALALLSFSIFIKQMDELPHKKIGGGLYLFHVCGTLPRKQFSQIRDFRGILNFASFLAAPFFAVLCSVISSSAI
jgi:hypothetical protein